MKSVQNLKKEIKTYMNYNQDDIFLQNCDLIVKKLLQANASSENTINLTLNFFKQISLFKNETLMIERLNKLIDDNGEFVAGRKPLNKLISKIKKEYLYISYLLAFPNEIYPNGNSETFQNYHPYIDTYWSELISKDCNSVLEELNKNVIKVKQKYIYTQDNIMIVFASEIIGRLLQHIYPEKIKELMNDKGILDDENQEILSNTNISGILANYKNYQNYIMNYSSEVIYKETKKIVYHLADKILNEKGVFLEKAMLQFLDFVETSKCQEIWTEKTELIEFFVKNIEFKNQMDFYESLKNSNKYSLFKEKYENLLFEHKGEDIYQELNKKKIVRFKEPKSYFLSAIAIDLIYFEKVIENKEFQYINKPNLYLSYDDDKEATINIVTEKPLNLQLNEIILLINDFFPATLKKEQDINQAVVEFNRALNLKNDLIDKPVSKPKKI